MSQEKYFLPFNTKDEIVMILKNYDDTIINLNDFQIIDTINNKTLYFADGFLTKCTINENCLKFEQAVFLESNEYIVFSTSYLILNEEYYDFLSYFEVNADIQLISNGYRKNFLTFFKFFQYKDLNNFNNYSLNSSTDNYYAFLRYYLFRMNFLVNNNNSKYAVNTQNIKSHYSYSNMRK